MASLSVAQSDGSSWSKLPLDLLNVVFERLGFADFQRAKSVCSSWLYASRQSAPNNQIPWLILLPEKGNDYCLLFNPDEEEKVYRIKDLGDNFANSHCLAICGSWLFMRDPRYDLFIMNLFTRERIDLSSVVSQIGRIEIERTGDDYFCIKVDNEYSRGTQKHINIRSPFLWIDEKNRDYVVIWSICYNYKYLVYSRKGDNCWKHASCWSSSVFDIVYKDQKVYLYSSSRDVKVLDFSGDIPRQVFETQVNYYIALNFVPYLGVWPIKKTHLVVTLTGEILRVNSMIMSDSDVWSFRIDKMDSLNSKWEKITCLGDEAILLDQGITVFASAKEGIDRNSIYFNGYRSFDYTGFDRVWSEKDIFIFNLETHKVKRPPQNIYSSIQSSDARWFVPNFRRR